MTFARNGIDRNLKAVIPPVFLISEDDEISTEIGALAHPTANCSQNDENPYWFNLLQTLSWGRKSDSEPIYLVLLPFDWGLFLSCMVPLKSNGKQYQGLLNMAS